MPSQKDWLQAILDSAHPLESYRAACDDAEKIETHTSQSYEDDLAEFHRLQSHGHVWLSTASSLIASTDDVLASINAAAHATEESTHEAWQSVTRSLHQHRQARQRATHATAPLYPQRGAASACRWGQEQGREKSAALWRWDAFSPPPSPTAEVIAACLRTLAPAAQNMLLANAVSASTEAARDPSTALPNSDITVTQESEVEASEGAALGATPCADKHPFERLQDDLDRRGETGGIIGLTFTDAEGHNADDGEDSTAGLACEIGAESADDPSPRPLFDVPWSPPPPPLSTSKTSPNSPHADEVVQPLLSVTPLPGAEEVSVDTSDFSAFSEARLQCLHAYVLQGTGAAPRLEDVRMKDKPASEASHHGAPTPAAAPATTPTPALDVRAAPNSEKSAVSAEPPPHTDPSQTRLRQRVRDALMAEQTYAIAAEETAAIVLAQARREAADVAVRDGRAVEQLQVLVREAEKLLTTVHQTQLQSWRAALAASVENPVQMLTSPRFALCCHVCLSPFSTSTVRTVCRRCGQFCCPDCVRDYGVGPDVYCPDASGNIHHVSLGWEPICGACYRHCAAYALSLLHRSQPPLITASPHTTGERPTPPSPASTSTQDESAVEERLRQGAADGVPLKHLVLSGVATREGDEIAADGFPPFYIYIAGDRSMSMTDRIAYHGVRSSNTWKSALKGTGTFASNLIQSVRRKIGSYRRGAGAQPIADVENAPPRPATRL